MEIQLVLIIIINNTSNCKFTNQLIIIQLANVIMNSHQNIKAHLVGGNSNGTISRMTNVRRTRDE